MVVEERCKGGSIKKDADTSSCVEIVLKRTGIKHEQRVECDFKGKERRGKRGVHKVSKWNV